MLFDYNHSYLDVAKTGVHHAHFSIYSTMRIINICSIQFNGKNLNASVMNLLVIVVCYIGYR